MSQSHPHNRNIGEIPFWGHIWILRAFTCTTTLFQFQNNFQNSRSFGPISGWSLWRLHDWLVVSTTHLKHILVKIGKSSPNSNRGENKQYLKPLPIAGDYHLSYKPPRPTHKANDDLPASSWNCAASILKKGLWYSHHPAQSWSSPLKPSPGWFEGMKLPGAPWIHKE